jgi:hypothetical protein
MCLEAVKLYGFVIHYIKNPSNDLCEAAVKNNIYAIRCAATQTRELCMYVIKQNGLLIRDIVQPTFELWLEAIKQNWKSIQYFDKKKLSEHERTMFDSIKLPKEHNTKIKALIYKLDQIEKQINNPIEQIIKKQKVS